jgi:hypothetical protein
LDDPVIGELSNTNLDYHQSERKQVPDAAWNLVGRKINKRALLAEIYVAAIQSIGLALDCAAMMFRLLLEQYLALNQLRKRVAEQATSLLADHRGHLMTGARTHRSERRFSPRIDVATAV